MSSRTETLPFEDYMVDDEYVGPLTTIKDAPNNGPIDFVFFSLDGVDGVEYAGVGQIINRPKLINKHGSETANDSLDTVGDVRITRNDDKAIPYDVEVLGDEEEATE